MSGQEHDNRGERFHRLYKWLLIGLGGLAVLSTVIWMVTRDTTAPKKIKRPEVVELEVVEPPPPPPPEQQPMEQPEPEMQEVEPVPEEPQMDEPPPEPDSSAEPPPPGPLALDAAGEGAPDGFALGGKPGGQGVLGGGGGGGSPYGWYAALMKGRIQKALQEKDELFGKRYQVAVQVWMTPQGRIQRVELVNSTGQRKLDNLLRQVLMDMPVPKETPPDGMPEPVVIQVSAS